MLKNCFFLLAFILICSLASVSQIRLPRLIGDSMVLQRDARLNIWGWATPGERISIRFAGRRHRVRTGADGKWKAQLPPLRAGGPYAMELKGRNEIILKDILVGDVWLCSGQSNMVLPMERVKEKYPDEIAGAHYPRIRQFLIPTIAGLDGPREDLPGGSWKTASPQQVLSFSATAFFFAREIYERYGVPIGLINASVGGTPVEAWISEAGLKEFPGHLQAAERYRDTALVGRANRAAAEAGKKLVPTPASDRGLSGPMPWYDTSYVPHGWKPITIPGYWSDQGEKELNGVVWYRREIEVPAAMTGMPAKIYMGRVIDADYFYVNGLQVGHTSYQYPPRRYEVPAGLLKPGKNLLVIRVINTGGKGGFVPDKPYYLVAGSDSLELGGSWQYKVGQVFAPGGRLPGISVQNQPTALFNAMIAPLTDYAVKGVLWYQGESNLDRPADYHRLLPALIRDWRAQWKSGRLPFLYVQLPNYGDVSYHPSESGWAVLREAQAKALSEPHTAMAVAIDLGEWNDIHPLNKKDVGRRLALLARQKVYGDTALVASGPLLQSARTDGSRIILTFSSTGSGLVIRGGEAPAHFAIAGADKKFVWAEARIEGNTVIVWSGAVPQPLYVRYAWADNPDAANLYNREGLPAAPFRTDE